MKSTLYHTTSPSRKSSEEKYCGRASFQAKLHKTCDCKYVDAIHEPVNVRTPDKHFWIDLTFAALDIDMAC